MDEVAFCQKCDLLGFYNISTPDADGRTHQLFTCKLEFAEAPTAEGSGSDKCLGNEAASSQDIL